ncbi:MAG: TolC family protein [Endomicrobium sp.]|jgi:outer membrane protein TolC|nr:TolC family protein [Endomicrobium sp.]
MKKLKLLSALALMLAAPCAYAYENLLTLQDYLNMVAEKNSELQSVQSNIDSVKGKIAEIERAYSYYLSAGTDYAYDASGKPYSFAAAIDNINSLTYDASINKQFETGTRVALGLYGSFGKYDFAFGGADYKVRDISPFISLSQSLLKDFNGGSTKASISLAKANAQSALYLLEYQKQSILLNATLAYWNLSYSRTVIEFRRTSLDRTQKILDWNRRRYNVDLAEKSDMLQSQAAVKMRELNLKLAYEDEIRANRSFNQFIDFAGDTVEHEIEKFDRLDGSFVESHAPEKKGTRYDVLSALENVKSASFAAEAQVKSMGADLVLSGQIGINDAHGRLIDDNQSASMGGPSFAVGVRYTLPLDFGLRKDINKGYESARISSQKAAEFAAIKENNEWFQLLDNWNNAKSRLALAEEIQHIQLERNIEDQDLLKKGRSTTYLVLQSEQDLDDANLSVLQGTLELISIYEQAKAFYNNNN